MQLSTDSAAPDLPFRVGIGSVVGGKFRVDRILAEGGMGVVVAATHLKLDQPVAMKFLRGEFGSNLEALARLDREAKAAAQLKSEHVARVLDVGVADDGSPYMVMEYLEGLNLGDVVDVLGVLDIPSVAEYAIQTCEGLAEAHACGIVHRDIKPDNLFLVERSGGWRIIKILDFGISKVRLADAQNVATGIIMGSPCYMSPEQLRSTASVDHRTDIWSLGATMHELLTGQHAFDPALSLPELVQAIMYEPATPVRQLRPQVPEQLAAVIDRCLAKDREARFKNAGEVAKALLPFAPARAGNLVDRAASMVPAFASAAGDDRRPPSEPPTVLSVRPNLETTAFPIAPPRRSRRRMLVASVIWAVGALLAGALILSLRGGSAPSGGSVPAVRPGVVEVPSPRPPAETVSPPEATEVVVPRQSTPTVRATIPDPAPRTVAAPPTARPPKRLVVPAASAAEPPQFVPNEVSSAGGRAPLRPIDTKNPFGSP